MEEEKLTWADIMQGFAELRKLIAESRADFEKRQAESRAEYEKRQAESRAEYEKHQAESRADAEKRQKEYEKRQAEYEKRSAELDARIAATSAEVGGIGTSNGMFAEDVYFRSMWRQKEFAGVHFDEVSDKMKSKTKLPDGKTLEDEFDIVMTNATSVALLETKYRARAENVKKFAETAAKNFRLLFPAYKDHKIYLGLGALSFENDVVEEARKYGVGLLQQVGETVEYAADWEVKAY